MWKIKLKDSEEIAQFTKCSQIKPASTPNAPLQSHPTSTFNSYSKRLLNKLLDTTPDPNSGTKRLKLPLNITWPPTPYLQSGIHQIPSKSIPSTIGTPLTTPQPCLNTLHAPPINTTNIWWWVSNRSHALHHRIWVVWCHQDLSIQPRRNKKNAQLHAP